MHVLQQRRTQLVLASLAGALVLGAVDHHALAQPGVAGRLGSPTGGAHQPPPPPPAPVTGRPPSLEVPIPPPPGAVLAPEPEVRYPIPSPEEAAAAEEPRVRIPSRITTRLRSIDANLQALAARGNGSMVNGVVWLVAGGVSITVGALRNPNDDALSAYLYVFGGLSAARGIFDFLLSPNAQSAAITYEHMPMTTAAEVRDRLEFGERALSGLAEQSLIARVVDASLSLAAGVGVLPIYLAPTGFAFADPLDYFVMLAAGASIVSAVVTLASTAPAEQRWAAYRRLRDRLRSERREEIRRNGQDDGDEDVDRELAAEAEALLLRPDPGPSFQLSIAPAPGGAFAGATVRF